MLDFYEITTRDGKRGIKEVYPRYFVKKSSDLMIRGKDFYAVWIEEKGLWSTDEDDLIRLIDRSIDEFIEKNKSKYDTPLKPLYLQYSKTKIINVIKDNCKKQMKNS